MPGPTVLADGLYYLTSTADGDTNFSSQDINFKADTDKRIYLQGIILSPDIGLTSADNDGAYTVQIPLTVASQTLFFKVGGRTALTGTIDGLTGLGTGTIEALQESPATPIYLDFAGMPLNSDDEIISLTGGLTNGPEINVTLILRVADPPTTAAPHVFVSGTTTDGKIRIDDSTPISVNVDAITIDTVEVTEPMTVKGPQGFEIDDE